jgi:hypothetical protein
MQDDVVNQKAIVFKFAESFEETIPECVPVRLIKPGLEFVQLLAVRVANVKKALAMFSRAPGANSESPQPANAKNFLVSLSFAANDAVELGNIIARLTAGVDARAGLECDFEKRHGDALSDGDVAATLQFSILVGAAFN